MTLSEYYCESLIDTHSIFPTLQYSMPKSVYVNTSSHDKMSLFMTLSKLFDYQFPTHVEPLFITSSIYVITSTNSPF